MADPDTLKDLAGAARERDGPLLEAAGRSAPYSYREFATNCFKAGNLLGHYGVHPGGTVAVAVGPKEAPDDAGDPGAGSAELDEAMGYIDAADPLLAVLGGASIAATVDVTPAEPVESRALVFPAWRSYELAPQCSPLAYGGPPDDPAVAHFEKALWSENPTAPPESVEAGAPALRADGEAYTHEALLATADAVVSEYGLDGGSHVLLSARVTEPGAFVAGVLAPMLAGATIRLPTAPGRGATSGSATDDGTEPTLRVVDGEPAEKNGDQVVSAEAVTASLRDTRRA